MKRCPSCHAENAPEDLFCAECGFALNVPAMTETVETPSAEIEPEAKTEIKPAMNQELPPLEPTPATPAEEIVMPPRPMRNTPPSGNKKWLWIGIALVVLLGVIVGTGMFLGRDKGKNTTQPTDTSGTSSKQTTASSLAVALDEYDDLIAEAKKLTAEGKFFESDLKLATIPASVLATPDFEAIQEIVADLNAKNEQGRKDDEKKDPAKDKDKDKSKDKDKDKKEVFTGDDAKWATNYFHFYNMEDQDQLTLDIKANGDVTQKNADGTSYHGTATIKKEKASVLSYVTDDYRPTKLPDTKKINSDVKITIKWDDNGGTQELYGYLSYSSRLALTDGKSHGDGVSELWIGL